MFLIRKDCLKEYKQDPGGVEPPASQTMQRLFWVLLPFWAWIHPTFTRPLSITTIYITSVLTIIISRSKDMRDDEMPKGSLLLKLQ